MDHAILSILSFALYCFLFINSLTRSFISFVRSFVHSFVYKILFNSSFLLLSSSLSSLLHFLLCVLLASLLSRPSFRPNFLPFSFTSIHFYFIFLPFIQSVFLPTNSFSHFLI